MTSLLEFVVRMKRLVVKGKRSESRDVRSEIGDDDEIGSERVEGRLRPGKDVRRTLIILGAIVELSLQAKLASRPGCGFT